MPDLIAHPPSDRHDEADMTVSRANIRDTVYALLRRRILSHKYPPGFRFDVRELSIQLGVSQTPVKEALQRLSTEGLITIVPRRGTFVATFETLDMAETYEVRTALERFAAPKVAANVTRADLDALGALLARMADLIRAPEAASNLMEYVGLDFDFHCWIVALARNRRLDEVYAQVAGPLQLARVMSRLSPEAFIRFTEPEHAAIFKALEARDGSSLADALAQHVEGARARLTEWFATNPI